MCVVHLGTLDRALLSDDSTCAFKNNREEPLFSKVLNGRYFPYGTEKQIGFVQLPKYT